MLEADTETTLAALLAGVMADPRLKTLRGKPWTGEIIAVLASGGAQTYLVFTRPGRNRLGVQFDRRGLLIVDLVEYRSTSYRIDDPNSDPVSCVITRLLRRKPKRNSGWGWWKRDRR